MSPPGRIRRCSRSRRSRQLRSKGFPVTAAVAPPGGRSSMGATLRLMRDTTAARPLLLLLRLPWHATASRPVLLLLLPPRHATAAGPVLLLLLLPRHATAAKNHTVVFFMASASPGPPVPIITADDKSVRVWVPPAYPPPALVSQFHGPCVESRRNGWCSLVAGG